jgi:hypothetical protein
MTGRFQIAALTPPWFPFQGQREPVITAALIALVVGATVNAALWSRSGTPARSRLTRLCVGG